MQLSMSPTCSRKVLFLALISVCGKVSALPELGDAPRAPTSKTVRQMPKAASLLSSNVYSISITNREEVRAFYNTVYQASENVAIGWTGDVFNCIAGNTATNFRDAIARRVNFFRAMAGVPAAIVFDATFNAKDQKAALMMSANNSLSHSPPPSWTCWSSDGTNAAANSNIALGTYGSEAMDGYIEDYGSGNSAVGHRRWILYPQTQTMGTGDIPFNDPYRAANALWVIDSHYWDPRPATRDGFVSWPPPGSGSFVLHV
jgi:hypothetical protein